MVVLATNWSTISSLATGVGTLVLAIATFASVRSSNRSARVAEVALQEQRRPVLSSVAASMIRRRRSCSSRAHWVRRERRPRRRRARERKHLPRDEPAQRRRRDRRLPGLVLSAPGCSRGRSSAEPHALRTSFRLQTRDLYIPRRRHRHVAGRAARLDDPDFRASSRRSTGAGADLDRAPLLRSGRRPADDHPVRADPDRGRQLGRASPIATGILDRAGPTIRRAGDRRREPR